MKHIVEGGTDAGSMLLFDPEALPDDYDERSEIDPCGILEAATLNGDAFWMNTDSDGGHLLFSRATVKPPDRSEIGPCQFED